MYGKLDTGYDIILIRIIFLGHVGTYRDLMLYLRAGGKNMGDLEGEKILIINRSLNL